MDECEKRFDEPRESSPCRNALTTRIWTTHSQLPQDAAYVELGPERSAADTEAAHELLSLAGVPPHPPATAAVLTVLHPPPVIPVYTYTIQPTAVYIVTDEPEPVYHTVQVPMQQVDYSMENPHPQLNYITYPEPLPPPPPLEYHPPNNVSVIQRAPESGTLTTLTIEEVTTDSEPEPLVIDEPALEQHVRRPMRLVQVQPPAAHDSDDQALSAVAAKLKRYKHACNECDKRYATSSNLSRHKQTHRSLDSLSARSCTDCGKVYVSMPALSMHMLTHSKGHVCGVCGKQFSRPWLLRGHVRSHTGEKPYRCSAPACGKAFADRSNLRAHRRTHAATKQYECTGCKRSFALKRYLDRHQAAACTHSDDDAPA